MQLVAIRESRRCASASHVRYYWRPSVANNVVGIRIDKEIQAMLYRQMIIGFVGCVMPLGVAGATDELLDDGPPNPQDKLADLVP